jgi:putative ABC transport system permease protein
LTKDFSKWVLVASLFSWPIAYFASKKWLQNFAFQADLHISIFILATLTTLIIALLTVSYQAMKAAMSNPVDVLRHE